MNAPLLHKSELIAALGHELRGPLGAINCAAEVLKRLSSRMEFKDPKDAELMAQAQAVIARQSGQIASVIDGLLSAAQVTAEDVDGVPPGSPR